MTNPNQSTITIPRSCFGIGELLPLMKERPKIQPLIKIVDRHNIKLDRPLDRATIKDVRGDLDWVRFDIVWAK